MSILSDIEALESIKEKSRPLYVKSWNQFKEYFQADELETQAPSETQFFSYFKHLRVEKNLSGFCTLWLASIVKA